MQVIQKIKQFLLHRSLISGSSDPGSGNRLRCSRNTYIKNQRNIRVIGSVSLVLLLTLTAFTLRPVSVSTDSAEATANPATTTLTVATSGNVAILDITPSSTSGTFSSSDNSGTSLAFNVSTNNITGYNLSISHGSSTTPAPLTSEDLSEDLDSLPTGTSITESQFNSTEYVGRYGYKPSKLNSQSNSNYIPAPTTSSTTLNKTTRANTTSDSYTIALGANIDYTKSAGTYTNTFILTAVANNVAYTINYLDNTGTDGTTGTDVSNLPATESASTATASGFTLSNTTPTKTNYSFIGWCDGTVTHNSSGTDTCASTTYQAGSAYTFSTPSATSANVANLYAMWKMEGYTITFKTSNASSINFNGTNYTNNQTVTIAPGTYQIYGNYATKYAFKTWAKSGSGSFGNSAYQLTTFTVSGDATITLTGQSVTTAMQNLSATSCTTTPKPVYDTRDNEVYWIQKLADNECWMLDNLRLGGTSTISLTSSNTHVNTTKTLPASGTANFDSTNGYANAAINIDSKNVVNTSTTDNWGYGSGKYGVYYNFCAASALTICTASNSSNASYDVCPKGWKMPTGGSSGQYQSLCDKIKGESCSSSWTDDGAFHTTLSTPHSGGFYNGSAYNQGSYGYFWSSTRNSNTYMYRLSVNSSSVYPQNGYYRYYGRSVRCILGVSTIADATYMQDVTSEMVTNTAEGTTATLIDKRDNQSYLVGKLADGKLWMLDNLRLGSSTLVQALSTSNTNMSSSVAFTLPTSSSSGFTSYNTAMINTAYANTTATSYGSGSGKIGVYYNYCAASAGTYCMAGGSGSGNASYDVCPAGWRMPTGGPSGEYQALCDKIKGSSCSTGWSDNQAFKAAFSTPLSGYFYGSSAYGRGSGGYFWSSTYYASNNMYYLLVDSSAVYPQYNNGRGSGFSVRCVLK